MAPDTIEISVKGKWIRVPALDVDGKKIVVTGKWMRIAAIYQERFQETDLYDPDTCVTKLKEQACHELRADIFTFAQRLPPTLPKYNFPMESDSVAMVSMTSFQDWWNSLPQTARKNVRRSQKRGVTITVKTLDDDLIKGIAEVNNDSAIRQGRPNYHFGKPFDHLKKDYSSFPDRSDFICAYVGNELIGFLRIVYAADIALLLNLTVKPSHYDKKPANALIARAIELCQAKGVLYLRYGMFNYGNKGDHSLREFKINNGFREVLIPRFYIPLTRWGRICVKAKLHRGLLGILPRGAVAWFVSARAKWYSVVMREWHPRGEAR